MKLISPSIIAATCEVYKELEKQSNLEIINDNELRVFRGSLLKAFELVTKTRQYYSPVFTLLELTSCITIIERGSRSVQTVAVLHGPPVVSELEEIDGEVLTTASGPDRLVLEAKVNELVKSFQGLDVAQALVNHEKRITELENQMKALTNQGEKSE